MSTTDKGPKDAKTQKQTTKNDPKTKQLLKAKYAQRMKNMQKARTGEASGAETVEPEMAEVALHQLEQFSQIANKTNSTHKAQKNLEIAKSVIESKMKPKAATQVAAENGDLYLKDVVTGATRKRFEIHNLTPASPASAS